MYDDLLEKHISTEDVYSGRLLKVKCDQVELPNGKVTTREWIKHPGASAVLPVLPDGSVVLVRQYRYPIQKVTLEIPAGKLDSLEEDPLQCAKRELHEETGYRAEQYQKILTIATTVGFSNEYIHIYLAENLTAGQQETDDDEFVNVVKMPFADALAKVKNGEIFDAKTVAAILYFANEAKVRR